MNIAKYIEDRIAVRQRDLSFRATVKFLWGNGAKVQREGQSAIDPTAYGVLGSYTPVVGDDVIVANLGGGWIILGKNVPF